LARVFAQVFAQGARLEAQPGLFAVLPAEPLDSVLVSLSPESVPVPAVLLGRPARALDAALAAVLAPMRRWFQRTQRMQEWPV